MKNLQITIKPFDWFFIFTILAGAFMIFVIVYIDSPEEPVPEPQAKTSDIISKSEYFDLAISLKNLSARVEMLEQDRRPEIHVHAKEPASVGIYNTDGQIVVQQDETGMQKAGE